MSKPLHTPGPWVASGDSDIRGADNYLIGMVNPSGMDIARERAPHDRRLMIAAPQMLEALKAVRPLLISLNGGHPAAKAEENMRDQIAMAVFETLDLALAKAEAKP